MNWYRPCAYDPEQKQCFHATGRKRLKALADALGFEHGSYNLRSNQGGIAVMWNVKICLIAAAYLRDCQPATRADTGILIRTCKDRKDYTGGRNHFTPLSWLDDLPRLARYCRSVLEQGQRF